MFTAGPARMVTTSLPGLARVVGARARPPSGSSSSRGHPGDLHVAAEGQPADARTRVSPRVNEARRRARRRSRSARRACRTTWRRPCGPTSCTSTRPIRIRTKTTMFTRGHAGDGLDGAVGRARAPGRRRPARRRACRRARGGTSSSARSTSRGDVQEADPLVQEGPATATSLAAFSTAGRGAAGPRRPRGRAAGSGTRPRRAPRSRGGAPPGPWARRAAAARAGAGRSRWARACRAARSGPGRCRRRRRTMAWTSDCGCTTTSMRS